VIVIMNKKKGLINSQILTFTHKLKKKSVVFV